MLRVRDPDLPMRGWLTTDSPALPAPRNRMLMVERSAPFGLIFDRCRARGLGLSA